MTGCTLISLTDDWLTDKEIKMKLNKLKDRKQHGRTCFKKTSGACSTAHRSNRSDHCSTGQLLDNFHRYPVEQNVSDCRQAIHYVMYRLPAIAAILFYWITTEVVQPLTCRT